MLNELMIVERGMRQANIEMWQRHPDVKDAGGKPTLVVQLAEDGSVTRVLPLPGGVTPWTLRDGQQNSFPFVQPKHPLWILRTGDESRERILSEKKEHLRIALMDHAKDAQIPGEAFANWPGKQLLSRLQERLEQLAQLRSTDAAVVPATISRFRLACDRAIGAEPQRLLDDVARALIGNLEQTAQSGWVELAVALLIGKKTGQRWECNGALLFEAAGYPLSIADQRLVVPMSNALREWRPPGIDDGVVGICGLTGDQSRLLTGNFPQPKLPVLGQTFLFAKNSEIGANDRYGRFSSQAMPVGEGTIIRLDAALRALTTDDRKNKTWRPIPGEAPKVNDLLLAFVEHVPDAPAAESLAEEDYADEVSEASHSSPDSVGAFEKRTERLIELIKAEVAGDVSKTPVQLAVLRKVDPANRKVAYSGRLTVGELYDAAKSWTAGERNVPAWLTLPVLMKGERKVVGMSPPHIAPLGVIAFSKQFYIRGGIEREEVVGLPAAEALRFYLDPPGGNDRSVRARVQRMLRLVLTRRTRLVTGTPHALRRGFEFAKAYDRYEALRTVTLLGVLLHKLSREKEAYMDDVAFKLGQLLAAADVVHAGYCADIRGGALPPALLGNQVFNMAQVAPAKALAVLSRRWKPYDGWAKKAAREPQRADTLIRSKEKDEQQRGWDIRRALRHAREMGPLASALAAALGNCPVDDIFRAELLLGYIAGLPKAQEVTETDNQIRDMEKEN